MKNTNKLIGELSALNHKSYVTESDMITIDKCDNLLYIYSRFHLWRDTIFQLDNIAKVLINNGYSFYLSSTRYGFPTVVVRVS
jgi:hypothetical protein